MKKKMSLSDWIESGSWNYDVVPSNKVKDAVKELNDKINQKDILWGQAVLNRKDTGKTVEHCFDGFFKGIKESVDEIFGEALIDDCAKSENEITEEYVNDLWMKKAKSEDGK